eukprot:1148712-Pelagomonas_calceolata.AAC.3
MQKTKTQRRALQLVPDAYIKCVLTSHVRPGAGPGPRPLSLSFHSPSFKSLSSQRKDSTAACAHHKHANVFLKGLRGALHPCTWSDRRAQARSYASSPPHEDYREI